ncbi:hypothetical protein [Spirosoma radiotolerans]|uniref:Uncharacterized protein n=1 Tax=Spirosoma radiotolerans TaxID=1379870 RepID=A0A0E3ZVE0_9BACT|nr:hypothetical protein [Spirosoma radiotolerans]AKD56080.1 hypothetical protein SD10_15430 [Spirosoma radiotolerans]
MPHTNRNLDRRVTRKKKNTASAGSNATARIPATKRNTVLEQAYQQRLILHAPRVKDRPVVGLPAVYGHWGRNQINTNNRLKTKPYRMPQIQHQANFGGTGLDEMVSTDTVASIVELMNKNGSTRKHIMNVTELLSREREEVRYLLWTTKDTERPLSGHPGSLSKSQTDMRRGLTGGHGDKDNIRANWVLNQYKSGAGTEQEKLADTIIMASIMTNQLFSEPFAQLDTVSPTSTALNAYHPVHGRMYNRALNGSVTKTDGFRRAAINTHNARERRKWATADRLMRRGYHHLVDPEIHQWITKGEGWADGLHMYMKEVGGEKITDSGPTSSTAYVAQKTDRQLTMSEWNTAVQNKTMQPAIGKPRPLMSQVTPLPLVTIKARPLKQQKLTHYFKRRHK